MLLEGLRGGLIGIAEVFGAIALLTGLYYIPHFILPRFILYPLEEWGGEWGKLLRFVSIAKILMFAEMIALPAIAAASILALWFGVVPLLATAGSGAIIIACGRRYITNQRQYYYRSYLGMENSTLTWPQGNVYDRENIERTFNRLQEGLRLRML